MTWVFIGLVVLVVAAVAAVAVGRGAGLSVAQPDRPEVSVPAGRLLTGADLDAVGFSVGIRGYRMDEVDDLLSRLAAEIDERDRRLVGSAGGAHVVPATSVPVDVVPVDAGAVDPAAVDTGAVDEVPPGPDAVGPARPAAAGGVDPVVVTSAGRGERA